MRSSDPRGSVDKAFSLLRAFEAGDAGGVGVSELARRTNLSKSTAHRLLATLVQNGAVQRAGDVYRLGPLFLELTQEDTSSHGQHVSEILTPFLAALFERTRMTVHLGYMVGTDVSYANKLHSVTGVPSPSRIGGRVPGYATGVGKAIMAWNEDLAARAIEKVLHQLGRREATDEALLEVILAANLGSGEFFLDKAAGWALREYSKTDPAWVRAFLGRHEVSALTRREGSKYL